MDELNEILDLFKQKESTIYDEAANIDLDKDPETNNDTDEDHALVLHAKKPSKTVKELEKCDLTDEDLPLVTRKKHSPKAASIRKSLSRNKNKGNRTLLNHPEKSAKIDVHKEPEITDESDEDHKRVLRAKKLSKTVKKPEICDLTKKSRPLVSGSKHSALKPPAALKKSSIVDNNRGKKAIEGSSNMIE